MLHAEQPARLDDVLRYLRLQGLDAGEPALLAQPVHELDAHAPIIDVLREVEKVDLERERRVARRARQFDKRAKHGVWSRIRSPGEPRDNRGQARADGGADHPPEEALSGAGG